MLKQNTTATLRQKEPILLQNAATLTKSNGVLQNMTGITKCINYYKMGHNNCFYKILLLVLFFWVFFVAALCSKHHIYHEI